MIYSIWFFRDNLIQMIFFYGEISKNLHEQEATFDFYQFLGKLHWKSFSSLCTDQPVDCKNEIN